MNYRESTRHDQMQALDQELQKVAGVDEEIDADATIHRVKEQLALPESELFELTMYTPYELARLCVDYDITGEMIDQEMSEHNMFKS